MRNLLSQLLAVGPELAAFILTSPLLGARGAYAITQQSAPSPNLDLSQLGRVAVAGDFDSISLYQYEGQNENVYNTNGSQSLLTRYPDGGFDTLALSDAYIETMCSFERNGQLQGVILGGNFTSVAGTRAQSIALWDANSGKVTALPGINGKVYAVYCDNDSGTVYVGGIFTAGNSTNAMAWTTQWTNLPFAGFNGQVESITKNAAGNIVFGGSFNGLGTGSTPTIPNGQVINLAGGNISASGTTTTTGFDDPTNIICKTGTDGPGNTWLLADNTGGWYQGSYSFGFVPTKLRLYNTKYQGRGTKSFYFEDMDNGGILNLNFIDSDGQNQSCSSVCPLPQGNTTFQDFFMEPAIGMNTFRIFITEWYGNGGGLAGIEMFQDDIYSFAVNDFNEPQCDDVSQGSSSTVNPPEGFWARVTNNGSTSSDYLSAYITNTTQASPDNNVIFSPDIQQSGNYSVLVYTPGCIEDGSCLTRGLVNFTASMTSGSAPTTTTIYQNNDYDKFDQIYFGHVDVDSDSFKPSVTLTPLAGQTLPQTIVAQRVRFVQVSSTGGLNGLYEYDPNKATVGTDFSKSAIDTAGAKLDPGASIYHVQSYDNKVYVAGTFSGEGIANIMSIDTKATPLPNGGLNADVQALYMDGSMLYLGGNFTSTSDTSVKGLNNVAAFDINGNKWVALGAGVDGFVSDIVPLALNVTDGNSEDCITVNGDFSSVNAYGGNAVFAANGFAVWVPSKNDWLNNVPGADVSITGKLLATTNVPGLQLPLYAGQISSQAYDYSGAAELVGSGSPDLQSLGIKIQPNTTSSSMRKRSIDPSQTENGVYTGLFYDANNLNVTVLGGHFTATGSGGSTVENLMFVKGTGSSQKITGASELNSDSTIAAMDTYDTLVFAGGSLTGTVNGNDLNGLIVYDLQKGKIASPHPPALAGDSVVVNAVAVQPGSSSVYVGGNFKDAGSLPCASLCYYDASAKQWNPPGIGLSGTITSMFWSSKTQLFIAGSLTVGGNKTTMATYDSKKQTFTQFTKASLPGDISALAPGSSNFNEFWAAGIATNNNSAFLSKYSGDTWTGVGGLGPGTIIRGLQVLSLTSDHGSTDLVSTNEVLMILGNINVPGFGNASAVLFNGTDFEPFILTNKDDGTQGTVASIFVSNPQNLMKIMGGYLAVGFVVLIALAISLALIFLIVVAGIFIERTRRRREGYVPMSMDKNGNLSRIPPETLLGGLNGEKGSPPKL